MSTQVDLQITLTKENMSKVIWIDGDIISFKKNKNGIEIKINADSKQRIIRSNNLTLEEIRIPHKREIKVRYPQSAKTYIKIFNVSSFHILDESEEVNCIRFFIKTSESIFFK